MTRDEEFVQGSWIPLFQTRRCGFQLRPLARSGLVPARYRSRIGFRWVMHLVYS
jgi:hypothetical protein